MFRSTTRGRSDRDRLNRAFRFVRALRRSDAVARSTPAASSPKFFNRGGPLRLWRCRSFSSASKHVRGAAFDVTSASSVEPRSAETGTAGSGSVVACISRYRVWSLASPGAVPAALCVGMSAKLRQKVVTAKPSATIASLPRHERTSESVSTIQRTGTCPAPPHPGVPSGSLSLEGRGEKI